MKVGGGRLGRTNRQPIRRNFPQKMMAKNMAVQHNNSPLFLLFSTIWTILLIGQTMPAAIDNCPMRVVRHIINRTAEATGHNDAPLQMQVIRRIMEDIYGGTWGVLIIKDADLISTAIHWTFPDHRHKDGSAAFCLHVEPNGWQYNVFKTGDLDTHDRLTVEEVIEEMNRLMNTTGTTTKGSKRGIGENGNKLTNSFSNSLTIEKSK